MEGGHWADHEGLWRRADGEKFLLRFSTADQPIPNLVSIILLSGRNKIDQKNSGKFVHRDPDTKSAFLNSHFLVYGKIIKLTT